MMEEKRRNTKAIVHRNIRRNKAFNSLVIQPKSNASCIIWPTATPFFEPNRCHISCLDIENPLRHMDLEIESVTVGGSPQIAVGLHPKDIDDTDINWAICSRPGLARELQLSFYNPNEINVAVFACIDGWNVNKLTIDSCDRRPKWLKPASSNTEILNILSSEEIFLEPFEQREVQLTPTASPFLEPYRIKFNGHRIDNNDATPLSVVGAYCGDRILYGPIDGGHWRSSRLRGILTEHIASDVDGWGDVSWWPPVSTFGLGSHATVAIYNPWSFRIRASINLEGYPLINDIYEDLYGLDFYE